MTLRRTRRDSGRTGLAAPFDSFLCASLLACGAAGVEGCHGIGESEQRTEPPALFAARTACASSNPTTARDLGRLDERAASIQMERAAFFPGDGVEAVNRLSSALDCFEVAGSSSDVARTSTDLAKWHERVTADFQAHRLLFKRSLDDHRLTAAKSEALTLLSFFPDAHESAQGTDPYLAWLSAEARRLSTLETE